MRTILALLLFSMPSLVLAQGPAPIGGPAQQHKDVLWDARATAGATFGRLRLIGQEDHYLWAGTLGGAVGASYRGRPHGGVSVKASLDVSYPEIPSMISAGVGFNYYPWMGSPSFLRLSAGPTVMLAAGADIGVNGEIEFHARRHGQVGLVAVLGGFYRKRDLPFDELWGVRFSLGVSFGGNLR